MRELRQRAEQIVRILCLVLSGLVLYELAETAVRWNPFRGVSVPELPVLITSETTNLPAGSHKTNLIASAPSKDTNTVPKGTSTNSTAKAPAEHSTSNTVAAPLAEGSNLIVHADSSTHTNTTAVVVTNAPTNTVASTEPKLIGTNLIATGTSTTKGTNLPASVSTAANGTNSGPPPASKTHIGAPHMAGMPGMMGGDFNPFQAGGKRGPNLPPAVQSRISKITDSEILAAVIRPLPMALLGIAGNVAFLRSDNGQTGLVKEGDSLDDIKLIRIGINRVLIEQNGNKKELTIVSGYGGESLLPKDSTHEKQNP